MNTKLQRFFSGREVKNASWIIISRVAQMVLSLLVGLISARYLGPGNYGLIGYGTSYVGLFSSVCTLGLNSILVKELIDRPDEQGKTLGTVLMLRGLAATASFLLIGIIVFFIDRDDPAAIAVTLLCSISLVFHIFDTLNYWFQSRYKSKISSLATLLAYVVVSIYKIILLVASKSVFWFAFSTSVDYICVAVFLLICYKRDRGPKLSFSIARGKEMLGRSYHYIIAGAMVSIYGQTDKLMLKQMLDKASVGYYTTATTICGMWTFVLAAIIDSMYPTIISAHKEEDKKDFLRLNKQLYAIVFYVSVGVSLLFCFCGDFAVGLLYGEKYAPAAAPLKVITWYTAFSYLGTARNAWIVCEHKQHMLKYIYIVAAVTNVILNAVLIPIAGATGAAVASLVTQIITSIVFPFLVSELRPNAIMMIDAIMLRFR